MWTLSAEVALLGGLLCLDRSVLQVMLSRPVVTGPLVGLMLGDPTTGLVTGAMTELLWIDRFHMGRYLPPNDTVVAVLVTGGVILAGNNLDGPSPELVAASVLLFAPASLIAQRIDMRVAESNDSLAERVVDDARRGNASAIARAQYLGMGKTFVLSAMVIFIALLAGTTLLEGLFPFLPERFLGALVLIYHVIPILGVSVALSTVKTRGVLPVFAGIVLVMMAAVRLW